MAEPMVNVADFLLAVGRDNAMAVVDDEGCHTYGELRTATAELIADIAALGLPGGSPVALCAPNGLFWIAGHLAVLALGHVSVPIPPTIPAQEVVGRVGFVGAAAVLLGARQRGLADAFSVPVVLEGRVSGGGVEVLPSLVAVRAGADAVHVFTSGTTGAPRVVRLTHANLRANTESILACLPLSEDDRILVVLPFGYVFGASLLYTHLRVGACLVIQSAFAYPEAVVNRLIAQECTGFAGVPSTFHLLLRSSSFGHRVVPSLRTIQQAGGKLSPVLVEELVRAQPQARIYIMYGQTEATARLSCLSPDLVLAKPGSVGSGIPGVRLSVRDEAGEAVRPGEVGEIWAEGANISPGYLNDPTATARKFPGGVLRTGDLAVADEDGDMFIVDRTEDFIKSWGFRISSQEIESRVMMLPEVIAVAALGLPDEVAGERVELAVVRRPGAQLEEGDVLRWCRDGLPRAAVPSAVRFLASLPLNENGKVAKARLRATWSVARVGTMSSG